ncbi:hypothetical protein [Brevundimonas sp.]|uniref:hypothetical protein n=1 Tax=Brevundimonas sp. TaxID=1871086 RepID=UPI002AB8EBEC|nr:hypothetical protein [Brevundimonas sp.]MDZ4361793.1 hypothetical protein [Brevundimonas sp.]
MVAIAVFALNLLALGLLLRHGELPDRLLAIMVTACIVVEPMVDHITIGTWRAGVGALNLIQFLVIWAMAERTDRWWLVLLGSLQMLIVSTHLMPLISPDHFTRTGVYLRQGLWGLISILLFVAVAECRAATRFAREHHGQKHGPRGGQDDLAGAR